MQSRPWNYNDSYPPTEPSERLRVQEPPLQQQQYDYGAPAVQQQPYRQPPSYRELPVYPPSPPEPTQLLPSPQPDRAYNSVPRGVNDTILHQGRLYVPASSY